MLGWLQEKPSTIGRDLGGDMGDLELDGPPVRRARGAVELVSPFSPDACVARLREAIDVQGFFPRFGVRPVLGRVSVSVSGRSVRLRKRAGHGNLRHYLVGRLEEQKAGAVFRGKVRVRPLAVNVVVGCGAGLVLLGQVAAAVLAIRELLGLNGGGKPWRWQGDLPLALVPIFPMLTLAFIVGQIRFWRWLARDEGRFLVAFVADVIGSRPISDASPWKPAKPRRVAPNPGGGRRVILSAREDIR